MRKSTLTKIICLVVLCLMVLPLVMACGKSHTIYFDANGGTVEEESRKVDEEIRNEEAENPTVSKEETRQALSEDEESFSTCRYNPLFLFLM